MDWVFTRPPLQSLKDIALIKTCTLFWTPVHSYKLNNSEEYENMWQEIEEKIKENVCHVNLPKSIEQQIMLGLNPIGLQILKWIKLHEHKLPLSHILADEFCWTQEGTVDLRRTAEIIVRNDNISVTCRYELASLYCLENYIQILWNDVPEMDRKDILCQNVTLHADFTIRAYWIYITTGNDNLMNLYIQKRYGTSQHSYHCVAFIAAAKAGYIVATKYFWGQLSPRERRKPLASLVTTAVVVAKECRYKLFYHYFNRERYADVIFFLMSHMSEEDQIKTFKECPLGVLMCFTDWTWQYFLVGLSKSMWSVIPKDDYFYFLVHLSNTHSVIIPKCIYQQLFSEVWRNTPVQFKKFIANHQYFYIIINQLLVCSNKENTKLLLGSAEVTEEVKNSILSSPNIMKTCEDLLVGGQCDILQIFIKECVLSGKGAKDFKQQFINFVGQRTVTNIDKFLEMFIEEQI